MVFYICESYKKKGILLVLLSEVQLDFWVWPVTVLHAQDESGEQISQSHQLQYDSLNLQSQ